MGSGRTHATQFSTGVTNTAGTVTNSLDQGAATNNPAGYYRIRLIPWFVTAAWRG